MNTYEVEIVDSVNGQFKIINHLSKTSHLYSVGVNVIAVKLVVPYIVLQTIGDKFSCMSINSSVCIWEFMFKNKDDVKIECWHANKKHLIIHYSDCTTEYFDINSGRLILGK